MVTSERSPYSEPELVVFVAERVDGRGDAGIVGDHLVLVELGLIRRTSGATARRRQEVERAVEDDRIGVRLREAEQRTRAVPRAEAPGSSRGRRTPWGWRGRPPMPHTTCRPACTAASRTGSASCFESLSPVGTLLDSPGHHGDADGERAGPGPPSHFVHARDELVPGAPQPALVRQVGPRSPGGACPCALGRCATWLSSAGRRWVLPETCAGRIMV